MKTVRVCIAAGLMLLPLTLNAQRIQQRMGRGVVAVKRNGTSRTGDGGSGALISWRKLAQEPEGTTYNVYRRTAGSENFVKMNSTPLKKTNYAPSALTANTEYAVTAITNGVEGEMSAPFHYQTRAWDNVWFDFDFDNAVIKRDDYRTKFVWPMDLDGSGDVDAVVVDRLFAGSSSGEDEEESDNASTTSHKIQAYRLDGTLLWTVDMGPNVNICGGQNDMVLAYDIDCDGRCEVIIRSSDGTRFWDKANEQWGTYVGGSSSPDTDHDGITDYRTQEVKNPPFYISIIDGQTGEEKYYSELQYGQLSDGGDRYGRNNRADYMSFGYGAMEGHYGIAYLDGIHPSLVMECADRLKNGVHHVYVLAWSFDWSGGYAGNWHHSATWTANNKTPGCAEFHQIRILDSDGDGLDELWAGGYGVNPSIDRFHSAGLGHGDRFIISDIDPARPGIEGFAIQQSALLGQCLYDAATGEHIKDWYLPSVYDVGRGACMDIDPNHRGYEIYSFTDDYIYNATGDATGETRSQWGISTCFEGFWWNGDLLREELSSPGGKGWGTSLMVTTVRGKARLIEFSRETDWNVNAATGTRPAFMGDITGDWREEVILVKQADDHSKGLTGFATNLPTNFSIYCLQQDPHYRGDCTTRGYYQHPNTSFYLGAGMPLPPLPPVFTADLRWKGGSSVENGFTSFDLSADASYAEGKSLMFDIYGDNNSRILINQPLNAPVIYLMNPSGHDYEFMSTHIGAPDGIITTGSGQLVKSMQGKASLSGWLRHTGKTIISEGTLQVNGDIAGPVELRAKGTLAGSVTLKDTITFEGALNYEGCRLMPGDGKNPGGVITSKKSVVLPGDVYLEVAADFIGNSDGSFPDCSRLQVEGDLTLKGTNYITVNLQEQYAAEYVLAECTGKLTANANNIKVRGLVGLNYTVEVRDQRIVLVIAGMREPATNVFWTGAVDGNWNYQTSNFSLNEASVAFVTNDAVIFPEEATRRTVNLTDKMVTSGVRFTHDSGTYTFNGEGGFSGNADLVMDGAGALVLNATKSDYTGKTILNSGTVTVKNLENKDTESCFGAGSTIEIGKATLVVNHTNAATNRSIVLTDSAAISIPSNSTTSLQSALTGRGVLVKRGAGQLNLNFGGANGYAGTVLEGGTLSQGAWNATFGKAGSKIDVTGNAAIQVFNNNSTGAVPTLTNAITVQKGKTLTIGTGQRCKIQGSLAGEGTVKISFPYVRGDFETTLTNFQGVLNPTGGQFRIIAAMNMQKGTFTLGAGVYASGVKSQSGTEVALTHKIGALSSTASDAQLGNGTWNVGYLSTNTTFAGIIGQNATLNKYGEGTLTLSGESAGKVVVNEGAVAGTGTVGSLTVQRGGALLVRGRGASGLDVLKVSDKVTLSNPVFRMERATGTWRVDTDYQLFTTAVTLTGTPTFEPAVPVEGCKWDYSRLASDGILRIVADPTSIDEIGKDDARGDHDALYDLSGKKVSAPRKGVYVSNGKKILVK